MLKPAVLHLACHGEDDGLDFYGSFVEGPALQKALKALSKLGPVPRLVVINACDSHLVAEELAECVEFVIGHCGQVYDKNAIGFSSAFYRQLAQGSQVSDAFDVACMASRGYRLFAKLSDPRQFALFPGGLSQASSQASLMCDVIFPEPFFFVKDSTRIQICTAFSQTHLHANSKVPIVTIYSAGICKWYQATKDLSHDGQGTCSSAGLLPSQRSSESAKTSPRH
jgi:hypothetical protein